jgi:hypothetical protein
MRHITAVLSAALVALGLLAVAPATAAVALTPHTCTSPVWSSSNAEGTDNIDPGPNEYWWVNNEAWNGSHGPQTIYVCSQHSWNAVSDQPNNGGAVETYPDTEYDLGGRQNRPITKSVAQYTTLRSGFGENFPASGDWDAAYDLWTATGNETMIWNEWNGGPSYWANLARTQGVAVTLGGVPYHFMCEGSAAQCAPSSDPNIARPEMIFFRDTETRTGRVDILAAYQWEAAHGYVSSRSVPSSVEYGVEICDTPGNVTFPMTGMTVTAS